MTDQLLQTAALALSDETVYIGNSKGYSGDITTGEVVFNTAMTGYQEILTDPSYHSQIISFTHPHIGNVGVNDGDSEAEIIHARGIVARHICDCPSNWRATKSLPEFLQARKIIAIDGVDTRALTRRLRDHGALGGAIVIRQAGETDEKLSERARQAAKRFTGISGAMLANDASHGLPVEWHEGVWQQADNRFLPPDKGEYQRHVVVFDCGAKKNILRELTARACRVTVLPYNASVKVVMAEKPDGILFSNGPGDPEPCAHAIQLARELLAAGLPLFGLCLGHQIIASALGAKTEKIKFGHHGANHPVQAEDGRVLITSQNHGFAVCADSLPPGLRATHFSLFDGSLQGLRSEQPPVITFQGHPEAAPGPHDAGVLFDDFIQLIDNACPR